MQINGFFFIFTKKKKPALALSEYLTILGIGKPYQILLYNVLNILAMFWSVSFHLKVM